MAVRGRYYHFDLGRNNLAHLATQRRVGHRNAGWNKHDLQRHGSAHALHRRAKTH